MAHAWPMTEAVKLKIGKLIISRVINNTGFPTTPEDGLNLLKLEGVNVSPTVTGVMFHQSDADGIMHIAIPPINELKAAHQDVVDSENYDIPITYKQITLDVSNLSEMEEFEFRIGDYSISHCG